MGVGGVGVDSPTGTTRAWTSGTEHVFESTGIRPPRAWIAVRGSGC